jgi:hypothetical protein
MNVRIKTLRDIPVFRARSSIFFRSDILIRKSILASFFSAVMSDTILLFLLVLPTPFQLGFLGVTFPLSKNTMLLFKGYVTHS